MSYLEVGNDNVVEYQDSSIKAKFIQKTYLHLAAAIALFVLIEGLFFSLHLDEIALQFIMLHNYAWLGVILVYGFASSMVSRWAHQPVSIEKQYLALFAGVVLEALIFLPLLSIATHYYPGLITQAAIVTIALFAGLSAVTLISGKDFSFLRSALTIGGFVAIGLIVSSILFGFNLGIIFSGAMIIFAAAAILYETSKITHQYHANQYVGASLSLFSSVGLLFWYVITFMMNLTNSD